MKKKSNHDRCRVAHLDENNKKICCPEPIYRIFKVKVFHPNSGRKTWQTWRFCKSHFEAFIACQGKGWITWYRDGRPECPVIDYKIDEMH